MIRKRNTVRSGGRASAEAIEKRRVARQLNTLLMGRGGRGRSLDGRTEKRRARLIGELKEGRGGRGLKPIDFVSHVNELLDLGESVSSLRRQGVKTKKIELSSDLLDVVRRTQRAYGFHSDVWKLLGLRTALESEGNRGSRGARRPRKTAQRRRPRSRGGRFGYAA